MHLPDYLSARARLQVLFSIPLAFSILFFAVSLGTQHTETHIVGLELLHSRVSALRGIADDAEAGSYGFLLTGDYRYMAALQTAQSRVLLEAQYIKDQPMDPSLAPRVQRLLTLVRQRVQDAAQSVRIQQTQGIDAALEMLGSGSGESTMQQVRLLADDLENQINAHSQQNIDRDQSLANWSYLCFIIGSIIILLAMIWLYHSLVAYIHARDTAHAQLRTLNAQLEQRIQARTEELQRFNDELQQFAYVASHDLQEPLRTITSFAQLLKGRYEGKLDEDADEFIGYIVNSARRMTDLINGLLALVRLRRSGQSAAPTPLLELVREAESSLQAAIRESGARLEIGNLPFLTVDRLQLAQVFQNLISNAIKYRREEPPVIRISARRAASNWIIEVADNGRGFDPQFSERIFGLFQRLHGRDVEGTGMGLSISRRVVERHGGRMWAESQEGVGSKFCFSLPVSLEAHPEEEHAETASA